MSSLAAALAGTAEVAGPGTAASSRIFEADAHAVACMHLICSQGVRAGAARSSKASGTETAAVMAIM